MIKFTCVNGDHMKNLLVVYNESIPNEVFETKNKHLAEVAKKYNYNVTFKSNTDIYTYLNTNTVKSFGCDLNYSCCLFFDHDAYLAKNLEMLGMNVVNPSNALLMCENKAHMYQQMIAHNISVPRTFILPELSEYKQEGIKNFVEEAINQLTLPIVIKEWFGESGKQVYLVKTRQDVFAVIDKFKGKNILLQEYISESAGSDIRLFVVKDKVVASLRRQAEGGSFRSNISLGGKQTVYAPTIVETKLAVDATKAMGCSFAIVDMLKGITGSLVCEVNSTANIYSFSECTGVDIYEILFREIIKKAK